MRPGGRAGIAGAVAYLVLTGAWLVLARPPGPRIAYEAWFIVLILVGLNLPGAANQFTLARAYLAVPGLVYSLQPGSLGLLATTVAIAGLTDVIDGTVARRLDRPTQIGGALDPIVDGIFFGAVAVGLAVGGAYPLWLGILVVARYALPAAVGAALLALGRRPKLVHTLFGQVSTTLIAGLLGLVALLRGLGQEVPSVVDVAEVVIPLSAVFALGNLAYDNRHVLNRDAG